MDLNRIFAIFDVDSPESFLTKLYSGNFTDLEQDILVEELTDNDMTVRDLVTVLNTMKMKNSFQLN